MLKYIVNSRFKRISIKVNIFNEIEVRVPAESALPKAEKFVEDNSEWISKLVNKNSKKLEKLNDYKFDFKDGDMLILFDEEVYRIEVIESSKAKYKLNDEDEVISVYCSNKKDLKRILVKFYRDKAREIFEERAAYFAGKLGVKFEKVFIKDQSSRWGSCSSAKNLNFNFRLLLAPERVLDYLVIHEVCHLREMNHSSRFWDLVESLMPDYKLQDLWLKENGFLLKYFLR